MRPIMSAPTPRAGSSGRYGRAGDSPRTTLTASADGTARLWDARTGLLLHSITNQAEAVSAIYLGEGDKFLVATRDDTVRVFDTATHTVLFKVSQLSGPLAWTATANGRWLSSPA